MKRSKRKQLEVNTRLRIAKSPGIVFEAIVNPKEMSHYFISSGSARLDKADSVTWRFADFGGQLDVKPQEIKKDASISFLWSAGGPEALVTISLQAVPRGATVVHVKESGWPADAKGIASCVRQTQGWMHMLCCLKAHLEYGINLRKGGVVK
jgi:uncharacterized protein YndB with AHSA1/START domain